MPSKAPKPKLDPKIWRAREDIRSSIQEAHNLLSTRVIETGWPTEVFWSVVTRLTIVVADLVVKSQRFGDKPVDFLDDVIVQDRVKNAGLLIRYMRDALCHVESSNHNLGDGYFSFIVARGQTNPVTFTDADGTVRKYGSEYRDDIAFIFGSQRIYYRRHLLRAFTESTANLRNFLQQ